MKKRNSILPVLLISLFLSVMVTSCNNISPSEVSSTNSLPVNSPPTNTIEPTPIDTVTPTETPVPTETVTPTSLPTIDILSVTPSNVEESILPSHPISKENINRLILLASWQLDIPISDVDFSPDGKYLALATNDKFKSGEVQIWDFQSGTLINKVDGVWSNFIEYSPDGSMIASGGDTVEIRSSETLELLYTLPAGGTTDFAFSTDQQYVVYGVRGGDINGNAYLIYLNQFECNQSQCEGMTILKANYEGYINTVEFSHSGEFLATGDSERGYIKIWNTNGWDEFYFRPWAWGFPCGTIGCPMTAIEFSPSDEFIAYSNSGATVIIFGMKAYKECQDDCMINFLLRVWQEANSARGGVEDISFGNSANILATISTSGDVYIWDIPTEGEGIPETIYAYQKHTNQEIWDGTSLSFSPDGTYLVAGYKDGLISILGVP